MAEPEVEAAWRAGLCSNCGRIAATRRPPLRAKDRDRGEPLGSAPPTPPYVRVRIRRFEKFR